VGDGLPTSTLRSLPPRAPSVLAVITGEDLKKVTD
jgi:hypothetical protein